MGVKSADLAREIGVHPQQVARWRSSDNIRVHQLQDICKVIGIGLDEFLALDK